MIIIMWYTKQMYIFYLNLMNISFLEHTLTILSKDSYEEKNEYWYFSHLVWLKTIQKNMLLIYIMKTENCFIYSARD